jgi:hypothetical protein
MDENVLVAMVDAARLSTTQLDRIAQSVLGTALSNISNKTLPSEQARDLIAYAAQYDLTRQVASAFLQIGADSPALQNLLLDGSSMTVQSSGGSGEPSVYWAIRIETKLDQVLADLARQANEQTRLTQEQASLSKRLGSIEERSQTAPLNWNIILVFMGIAAFAALLTYLLPRLP